MSFLDSFAQSFNLIRLHVYLLLVLFYLLPLIVFEPPLIVYSLSLIIYELLQIQVLVHFLVVF